MCILNKENESDDVYKSDLIALNILGDGVELSIVADNNIVSNNVGNCTHIRSAFHTTHQH